jgi:hypothetical protein
LTPQATPLPAGATQVPAVPHTVPAAVQAPLEAAQQSCPEPPHATQVDVAAAHVRLLALHGATPAPVQQGLPEPPQATMLFAVTVNIVVLPVTETMTVALRAPVADAVNLSDRVQLAPVVPVPVRATPHPLTVSSVVLLLLITGTLVATSPPLLIVTDDITGTPMVTVLRATVAGLADNPAGC